MRLYDTRARDVVDFVPHSGRAGIYVCGITPYDSGHLGHAFTYHTFDVLARRLRHMGVNVRMVRNITDVDDDMLRTARERNVDYLELANSVVDAFNHDMASIDIAPVDAAPRASENIASVLSLIQQLHALNCVYAVDGWVYFDVATFPRYGELSQLDEAQMVELSRQRGADPDDPRKRHPLDFVVWRPSNEGEPSWPSRFGAGRPGWHIECSAMSAKELGLPVDIHGGGDDLIYPHHESEIAQSEGAGAPQFVRHWMHCAVVGYQGEKMSKSLGNLVLVSDLVHQQPAAAVRLMIGQQHYRSNWEYEPALLDAAAARLRRYQDAAGKRVSAATATAVETDFLRDIDEDLNVPGALRVIDAAVARATDEGDTSVHDAIAPLLALVGVRL